MPKLIFVLLVSVLQLTLQASLPEDLYYTAGVVEFQSAQLSESNDRLRDNLEAYLQLITSPEASPTDIIVFPELTLNNNETPCYVPNPDDRMNPCLDDSIGSGHGDLLAQLSCTARNVSKYLVVNIVEMERCLPISLDPRPCSSSGYNLFNTNVVFDRSGVVISRYRKVNLYYEPRNVTYLPGYGMFDTDFGVKFGHFTCFDIMFYMPAQEMAEKHGITDFIFPTMWFSQLPFLTGVQTQMAWAYALDVNFLTSGASNPSAGSTGTAVIAGRQGLLAGVMKQGDGERRLYVAQVPKKHRPQEHKRHKRTISKAETVNHGQRLSSATDSAIKLKRDYLEHYTTALIDFTTKETSLKRQLCPTASFCCNFELNWQPISRATSQSNSVYYSYRLAALDDWRREGEYVENRLKNCALIACLGDDIVDCGKVLPGPLADSVQPQIAFKRIVIEATFPKASPMLLMPNSVKDDLMPLDVDNFEWHVSENDHSKHVRYVLNTSTDNLMNFSIYGNYFNGSGSGNNAVCIVLLLAALALTMI